MKTSASYTLFFLLGLGLSACERNEIDESKPLIKSISFAGIPASDVTIDQRLHQITVRVPALLPSEGLIPTLELTQNARVAKGLTPNGKLDLTAYCECGVSRYTGKDDRLIITEKVATNAPVYVATEYRIVLVSPLECYEPNGDSSLTYTRTLTPHNGGQDFLYFNLSIRNLYKGARVRAVNLRNVATDKTYTSTFGDVPCINSCDNDSVNQLRLPFDTKVHQLPTGEYEFSISTSCSPNPVVFPTRITFTK